MIAAPIVLEALPRPFVAWALSADRAVAATLGADGGLLLWRVGADGTAHLERRIATATWSNPLGRLDAVALSKTGRYASLRRPDGGFDLWATTPARLMRSVSGSKDESWRSAWTPAGDAVLLETAPERTRLVRLSGGALDLPLSPPWAFTPDGKEVLGGSGGGLALVDLATGRVRRRFAAPGGPMPPYAFSPDGRLLASAGDDPDWKGPGRDRDGGAPMESAYARELRIDVWRVADGKLLRSAPGYPSFEADEARIFFLDARRLAAPTLGKTLDAPTGRAVGWFDAWARSGATLDLAPGPGLRPRFVRFPPDADLGRNVAASPDGRLLVTGESGRETRLLVWDAATRRLLRRVRVSSVRNLRSVAFAPDGSVRAEGDPARYDPNAFSEPRVRTTLRLSLSGNATVVHTETVAPLPGLPRGLGGTFAAPDGSFALAAFQTFRKGRSEFEIARLDRKTGERAWTNAELRNPRGPIAFAPDGRSFAFAWIEGPLRPGMKTTLGVFDAATGRVLRTALADPDVDLWKSAFSCDGSRLFVATTAGIEVRDVLTLARLARTDEAQDSGDVEIASLPDGGFAAVRRGRDLRLFDRDARLLATLVSFPGSGWAGWTPRGEAWGSPEGLARLRRPRGDRMLPVGAR